MRNVGILTTLIIFTLGTACVQQTGDHPIKNILPTADEVAIDVPGQAAAGAFAVGDLADYYVVTRDLSRDLNGGAAWVLILVHTVVQYPATSVSGDTYTWGPHSDALDPAEWRLQVTELADGSYDWSLDGRSKITPTEDFLTIIAGNAVPGEIEHHGNGNFTIDFDAAEIVNPLENDAHGVVQIAYDLNNLDGSPATLDLSIDTQEPDENGTPQDVHFDYSYAENLDGSGDLAFAIHGDLDDDGSLFEDALIRSRWEQDGQGRADIMVSGGDLADTTVVASECWDTTFRRVYYSDSEEWAPTEGDVADCVYADQDLPN